MRPFLKANVSLWDVVRFKDTNLFGPLIDQALEDADDLLERFPARLDDEERVG